MSPRRSASRSTACGGRSTISSPRPAPTRRAEARLATSTSVAESAEALARTLRRLHAERGVTIAVDVPPDLRVRVDREDLDEMLGNLLDNACKWARSRACVSARARRRERSSSPSTTTARASRRACAQAVLERGVRADEAAPGSGLGLAIVRDLAAACGGDVGIAEAPIGGLRVRLALPIA